MFFFLFIYLFFSYNSNGEQVKEVSFWCACHVLSFSVNKISSASIKTAKCEIEDWRRSKTSRNSKNGSLATSGHRRGDSYMYDQCIIA